MRIATDPKRLILVEEVLKKRGVRLTPQRRMIVRRATEHLHFTAEELVADVQKLDASLARGTIYRTLILMGEAGILEKHHFRYGPPYYEVTLGKAHHDHLMCIQCGEIIEYQEPRVERIQHDIVKRFGYELVSHTHKLYGLCRRCRKVRSKPLARKRPNLHVEVVV